MGMDIELGSGTYVVAVSGGVDSVVLLHMLMQMKSKVESRKSKASDIQTLDFKTFDSSGVRLIVAHFDHGMREDSAADQLFVQRLAAQYQLPYIYDEGRLGADASEDTARRARYAFLNQVKKAAGAQAIITAHHQDDLLETAIINLLRGTARRGLSPLINNHEIVRPLLRYSKQDLKNYASQQGLVWREDSTNQDTRYLRNYVRHKLLHRFTPSDRQAFLGHIEHIGELNQVIDGALINHLHLHPKPHELDRHTIIMLPHRVALDTLASWLRLRGVSAVSRKRLEKLLVATKTWRPNKCADIDRNWQLLVQKDTLALRARDR